MLTWIIDFSLANRLLVLCLVLAAIATGVYSVTLLEIDAFPDTTPVQVQVNTVAPALGPDEIEAQITAPIEQVLSGLPKLTWIRSISKFGFSQITMTFREGTDLYFARQVISERLATVQLPAGIERPKPGPVSTGLGEVFHYVVSGTGNDITELRTIQDWIVRPQMRKVPGIAEINSWGGYEKQYHVRLDLARLVKHGLSYADVAHALEQNNRNVGGGTVTSGGQVAVVQGLGRTESVAQIEKIVVHTQDGVPVRIKDLAEVVIGHEIRRGAASFDGKGEAVLGLGFMTIGENSHTVTWGLKNRLNEVKSSLPRNVQITPVYDRTELVETIMGTVKNNLFEGGLLVVAVLFAFLGHLRAAIIVALAIPLSLLFAFTGMYRFGIAASLLSLGAIDFGLVVDSSVVMIENCVRRLASDPEGKSKQQIIREAALEVRKPTLFGELIIMIVYLPILTLEGIEGKLFRPMALTILFALAGSMVLSLTLMPVLASIFLSRQMSVHEPILMRLAQWIYAPIMRLSIRFKWAVLAFAIGMLVFAFGFIAPNLGSEFVPKLSEGAICISVVRPPGTDMAESIRANTIIEKRLLGEFPDEVRHVWSRIGSAEIATDPMGIELTDVFITLKPRSQWTKAQTQAELTELFEHSLRHLPGQRLSFSQPIELRFNEIVAGIRADIGVKIFGDDFAILTKKAQELEAILKEIPGAADLNIDRITGQPMMQIKLKQDELARYGLSAAAVLQLIESLGNKPVGEVLEGTIRFPLVLRLGDPYSASPASIEGLLVPTSSGERIPLGRLATISTVEGTSTITREWGQRLITVTCNVRNRDLGSFVEEAQQKVATELVLPVGRYHVEWGGQYGNLIRAKQRLYIVVPLAFLLIFGLLYATYGNISDSLRVFTAVPFAWVGGLIALWLRDLPFSVSAAVGFVALSGVAVLDDMILVSTVRRLRDMGLSLDHAVQRASMMRLRPVLMTSLVASLGFVPMAISTGVGAEVQRPLATVVIGGVVGSFLMSLLVLRVLYLVFSSARQRDRLIVD